jgi:NhaP-type Na+/H+ or K+/H+ antiporter
MIFAAAILVYVMWRWDSTSLAETLALGSFGLIGTVVAAYVGGAAYEDVRLFKRQDREDDDEMGEEPHVH